MTKKRRTKREKIVASSRKSNFDFVFDTTPPVSAPSTTKNTQATQDYAYVISGARITLLTTALIAAANLLLFIALKQGYIDLFGLQF